MDTIDCINQNIHLRHLSENDKYIVYDRLAEKLSVAVKKFIDSGEVKKQESTSRYKEVTDYMCLLPEKFSISRFNCSNLMDFVIIATENEWKFKVTTIVDFWKRVKNYRIPRKTNYEDGHNSLDTLNLLSIAAGYDGFEDFLSQEFKERTHFKLLILPLWGSAEESQMGMELLRYRFKSLKEKEKLSISMEILDKPIPEEIGNLTISEVHQFGIEFGADLVIWGNVNLIRSNKIELKYHIMNADLGFTNAFWEDRPFSYSYSDLDGFLPTNLDAVIFWCFGIMAFQGEQYDDAIYYFSKILKLEIEEKEEIYFRIGVFYDLKEETPFALHYYCLALSESGVPELDKLVKAHLGFQNFGKELTHPIPMKEELPINGNLVVKNNLSHPESFKPLKMKLFLFELVRIRHALLLKGKVAQEIMERFLRKAVGNMKNEWFETDYREFIAQAYYELAVIYTSSEKKMEEFSPELIRETIYCAIKLSEQEDIHKKAISYFKQMEFLNQVVPVIEQAHGQNSYIARLYRSATSE